MRAILCVLATVAAVFVMGCGPKKEELPQMEPVDVQAATPPPPAPATQVETPAVPTTPARPSPSRDDTTTAGGTTYRVQKGDTLFSLAKRFYGDGKLWPRILDANRDKIRDETKVPVGTLLVIPPK